MQHLHLLREMRYYMHMVSSAYVNWLVDSGEELLP